MENPFAVLLERESRAPNQSMSYGFVVPPLCICPSLWYVRSNCLSSDKNAWAVNFASTESIGESGNYFPKDFKFLDESGFI